MLAILAQATFVCFCACIVFVGNLAGFGVVFPNLFNGSWVSMTVGLAFAVALIAVDVLSLALVAKFVSKKLKKGIDNENE